MTNALAGPGVGDTAHLSPSRRVSAVAAPCMLLIHSRTPPRFRAQGGLHREGLLGLVQCLFRVRVSSGAFAPEGRGASATQAHGAGLSPGPASGRQWPSQASELRFPRCQRGGCRSACGVDGRGNPAREALGERAPLCLCPPAQKGSGLSPCRQTPSSPSCSQRLPHRHHLSPNVEARRSFPRQHRAAGPAGVHSEG